MAQAARQTEAGSGLAECIRLCQECHDVCLEMLTQHCLVQGGAHVEQAHVVLMLDCIDICRLSADFMRRGSAHHGHACAECADICAQCAESCAELDGMERCVEACQACAESCRQMAA